jgi:ATP-dependent RNA helicase DeaD
MAQPIDPEVENFEDLGLDARLVHALSTLGYEEPTPIQRQAIPHLLAGRDLIGQAAAGTGKTAAFALPLLQRLHALERQRSRPSALVLVPTRELAMQVAEAVHRYGRPFGTSVLPIYGGQSFGQQLRVLERGVDVVVATPGRALDHIRRGTLRLDAVSILVLDEADEMLDMGFAEDIEAIVAATPEQRQTMLFSVTLPPRILAIARRHLKDAVDIKVAREKLTASKGGPRVRQTAYIVNHANKLTALGLVLDLESPTSAFIFCRTRLEVDELTEKLAGRGYRVQALHGGMPQDERARVMKKIRGGAADLVVATDVAARGIDIEHLSHVFNYNVPSASESYVHRIGRVGRAGREGVAITLAEPREHRLLRNIEQHTRQKIAMAALPTVADLQAKRLELTRGSLQAALSEGNLDQYRVVVESLAAEHDVMEIALAAVKLAHLADGRSLGETEHTQVPRAHEEGPTHERQAKRRTLEKPHTPKKRSGGKEYRGGNEPPHMVRLHIGVGRSSGVRAGDLVGAITGEAGVAGRVIGTIEIAERHSIVEVAEDVAPNVLRALRGATIKGKKTSVRRE